MSLRRWWSRLRRAAPAPAPRAEVIDELAPFMEASLREVERLLAKRESEPEPAVCGCGDPQHRDRGGWVHPKAEPRSA